MVGEPNPRSFEISGGVAGQVDGQKGSKTLAVSDNRAWALGQLELGSSGTSEADIRVPQPGAALGL